MLSCSNPNNDDLSACRLCTHDRWPGNFPCATSMPFCQDSRPFDWECVGVGEGIYIICVCIYIYIYTRIHTHYTPYIYIYNVSL